MINVETLKTLFHEKLQSTGSLDDAFKKAVWVAYKTGFRDGTKQTSEIHPSWMTQNENPT